MPVVALTLIAGTVAGIVVSTRFHRNPTVAASTPFPSPSIDRTAPDWFVGLPFNCLGSTGVGLSPTSSVALVSAVGSDTHAGYDRVVIQFAGGGPAQAQLATQRGAVFTQRPSGKPVTLKGANGALVTLPGADGHTQYSGTDDLKPSHPRVLEVRKIQDFEGTVQWAIGLSRIPCYRMAFLDSPVRLVIDFGEAPA